LTNLSTGNFSALTYSLSAEPVPYGLAGYIYGIETIPQYQGKFTLMEQEISDACPIGSALNLSGGRAEWAAMNACVQQVNYDDSGRTEIVFGPAEHLDNADVVAMNRFNRGPRWLYEVGSDQMNQSQATGNLQIGSNLPASSPSAGNPVQSDFLMPQSLSDLQAHDYTTALPGIYAWAYGLQRAGLSALDNGPGLLLASGSGGALTAGKIKISLTQLRAIIAGQDVQFCEMSTCEGAPPAGQASYRAFLCTGYYYH
jgi:hypothetical protein